MSDFRWAYVKISNRQRCIVFPSLSAPFWVVLLSINVSHWEITWYGEKTINYISKFLGIFFFILFFKLSQFCTLHLSDSKCVMHREEAKLYDDHHPHFQNKMDLKQSPNLNVNVALQQNYLNKKYMNVVWIFYSWFEKACVRLSHH